MLKGITLKKVKLMETLSFETPCFSCDVYQDNKLIAYVSNSGQGGPNSVRPANRLKYSDVNHIDNMDAECEIMSMVEEISFVKKNQSNKLCLKLNDNFYTVKLKMSIAKMKKMRGFDIAIDTMKKKYQNQGYEIINTNI